MKNEPKNQGILISFDQTNKLARVFSSGHFAASGRDDIWVIIMMHQIILIMVS